MSEAARRITAERDRQRNVEGWSDEHDDVHDRGELLAAARVYMRAETQGSGPIDSTGKPFAWPWPRECFKPRGRVRNLERAGALAQAEIDRLERAGMFSGGARVTLSAIVRELDCELTEAATS